jgi:hypothetical protein
VYLRFGKVRGERKAHSFGSISDPKTLALNPDSYVVPRPNEYAISLFTLVAHQSKSFPQSGYVHDRTRNS